MDTRFTGFTAPAGALHWRRWDDADEMVVHDAASGSTHLLSPAAAEVLLALLDSRAPQDAAQLAQRLLPGDDGAAPLEDDVRALQSLLFELARLDLVHRADRP
jgi:PqqD family protein of HPr-rel-A system